MSRRHVYRGVLKRSCNGHPCQSKVVLCRPADWPRLMDQIPASELEQWSTLDLGTHFLAIGPPTPAGPSGFNGLAHGHTFSSSMSADSSGG
jgi:hypothetical protein